MAQRILITEFMDAAAVEQLAARFDVDYRPRLVDDAAGLEAAVPSADAWIVRNRTKVRGRVLEAAAKVRVIGRLGVGLDNIDVHECERRGISVIPATGANAESVAEYVIATAMMLLRGAYFSSWEVASGKWPREALGRGREIGGKTLGLVGFGSIGRITASKGAALGMKPIAFDPQLDAADPVWNAHATEPRRLEALLGESDVLSLHLPLAPETRGLFGAATLERIKPGAILVNTSRGGIVDEAALVRLLHEGRLGGAALDVYNNEPLEAGSPLEGAPRLILTPHIAGVTLESNERVSAVIAERVAEALAAST